MNPIFGQMWQFEGMKWPKLGSHYVMSGKFQWWLVISCAMLQCCPRDRARWYEMTQVSEEIAIVGTLDFFTPIVDEPEAWRPLKMIRHRWSPNHPHTIYIYTTIHPYYHIWFIVYIVCILDDYYHNMDGSYIWMVGSHTWMVWLAQNNLLDPFGDFTYLHIVTCVLVKMHDDMMSVPETVDHDARHDFHIFRGDGPIIQIYPDHVTPLRTDMEPRTLKLKHRFEKYVWDDVGC